MKKVIVKNKHNHVYIDIPSNLEEYIEFNKSINTWGLPERWILNKELIENGNPNEPEHWMWHSGYYEESEILKTEERKTPYLSYEVNEQGHTVEVQKERTEIWILLKADYTIEIIDLEKDYDWLLSECHKKRKAEYPPYEDYLDAVVKGDEQQKQEYIDKCLEIKNKYPKPIKENL